jgi:hypothetical protein
MATKFKIEKFNGSNFSLWKLKIRAVLRKDNCLDAIDGRPADITDQKWKEMDDNAVANLHLAMADSVLSSIAEKKSAKEIWDALIKLYEVKSLHTRIFLKRRLYTLRMNESISITNHINTMNTLFAQLTASDFTIAENERAELLLQSLPDSYDQLIINITNNNIADSLHFDDVAGAIIEEESRRKNKEERIEKQAEALVMARGRSTERGSSGSQDRGRSKSQRRKNFKCYSCGMRGHYKRECWNNKRNGEKTSEASTSQGCVASTSDDGEILYSGAAISSKGGNALNDGWIVDLGATWHMT